VGSGGVYPLILHNRSRIFDSGSMKNSWVSINETWLNQD